MLVLELVRGEDLLGRVNATAAGRLDEDLARHFFVQLLTAVEVRSPGEASSCSYACICSSCAGLDSDLEINLRLRKFSAQRRSGP